MLHAGPRNSFAVTRKALYERTTVDPKIPGLDNFTTCPPNQPLRTDAAIYTGQFATRTSHWCASLHVITHSYLLSTVSIFNMMITFFLYLSIAVSAIVAPRIGPVQLAPYPDVVQEGGAHVQYLWRELAENTLRRTLPFYLGQYQVPWSQYLYREAQLVTYRFFG